MANSVGYHESEDKLATGNPGQAPRPDLHDGGARGGRLVRPARRRGDRRGAASEILAHNRDEEKEHFVDAARVVAPARPEVVGRAEEPALHQRRRSSRRSRPTKGDGGSGAAAAAARLARHRQPEGRDRPMNNLLRELAPISSAAWDEIDDEAQRVLKLKLAGRKLVDFDGPLGPERGGGQPRPRRSARAGPGGRRRRAARRTVLPLVELRTDVRARRAASSTRSNAARKDPDLDPLVDAATRIAQAEDIAHLPRLRGGRHPAASTEASPHPTVPISDDYEGYPQQRRRSDAAAARRRRRRPLRDRPRPALLHRPDAGHRRRRLSGARTSCASWSTVRSSGRRRSTARSS